MKPKIKEILFDAFAVICVSAGFSIHGWPSFCFLLTGSICGTFALYFTLTNHRVYGVTKSQARYWGWLFFAVSFIGVILFWLERKQPTNPDESKLYPHFKFILRTTEEAGGETELTNDFLISNVFNKTILGDEVLGCLFVPVSSNAVFRITVKNDGPEVAEDAYVMVSVINSLACIPGMWWHEVESESFLTLKDKTFPLQIWLCKISPILPGDGETLPDLTFSNVPIAVPGGGSSPESVFLITIRAKDSPAQGIACHLVFVPFFTNVLFKPVVLLGKTNSEGSIVIGPLPKSILDLQK